MHDTFPAFQLLLVLSATLIIGLPLLVWLFMRGNRDQGAHLWFMAVVVNATALVLVGYLQRFSAVSAVLFLWGTLLAVESMRWELGQPGVKRWIAGLTLAAYTALQLGLEAVGLRMSAGYTLNLFLLLLAEALLIWALVRVSRLHQSRGLLMVALGVGIVFAPNVFRLVGALMEGGGTEAFSGSPATNVAVVVITLVSVLQVVGYGGFVMEKLHQRQLQTQTAQALATERQQLAERHAQAMETVVRQRDEMLLLNSRFSTVSNMALYNSAIVHEISQPLQALLSILDTMALRTENTSAQLSASVRNATTMVQKMAGTLGALRALMGGQQPSRECLNMDAVLEEILPILQTQARRQNVVLERQCQTANATTLLNVNKVLLQRLIFNLVTNSFEAMAAQGPHMAGRLLLATDTQQEQGVTYSVLRVQDNGPGLPDDLQLQPRLTLRTTKENGVGVGLGFTQMIVESWRGHLRAHNIPPEEGGGALVEVCIPVARGG